MRPKFERLFIGDLFYSARNCQYRRIVTLTVSLNIMYHLRLIDGAAQSNFSHVLPPTSERRRGDIPLARTIVKINNSYIGRWNCEDLADIRVHEALFSDSSSAALARNSPANFAAYRLPLTHFADEELFYYCISLKHARSRFPPVPSSIRKS